MTANTHTHTMLRRRSTAQSGGGSYSPLHDSDGDEESRGTRSRWIMKHPEWLAPLSIATLLFVLCVFGFSLWGAIQTQRLWGRHESCDDPAPVLERLLSGVAHGDDVRRNEQHLTTLLHAVNQGASSSNALGHKLDALLGMVQGLPTEIPVPQLPSSPSPSPTRVLTCPRGWRCSQ